MKFQKNILISHEKRRRLERKRKERTMENQRELIGPLTRKPERVNKSDEN